MDAVFYLEKTSLFSYLTQIIFQLKIYNLKEKRAVVGDVGNKGRKEM